VPKSLIDKHLTSSNTLLFLARSIESMKKIELKSVNQPSPRKMLRNSLVSAVRSVHINPFWSIPARTPARTRAQLYTTSSEELTNGRMKGPNHRFVMPMIREKVANHVVSCRRLNNCCIKVTVRQRKRKYFGYRPTSRECMAILWERKSGHRPSFPGSRTRGRPMSAWIDNNTSWTGLPLRQLLEEMKDRICWRAIIRSVTNSRNEDGFDDDVQGRHKEQKFIELFTLNEFSKASSVT